MVSRQTNDRGCTLQTRQQELQAASIGVLEDLGSNWSFAKVCHHHLIVENNDHAAGHNQKPPCRDNEYRPRVRGGTYLIIIAHTIPAFMKTSSQASQTAQNRSWLIDKSWATLTLVPQPSLHRTHANTTATVVESHTYQYKREIKLNRIHICFVPTYAFAKPSLLT